MFLKIFPIIILLLIRPASAYTYRIEGSMPPTIGENITQPPVIPDDKNNYPYYNQDNLKARIDKLEKKLETMQDIQNSILKSRC